MKLLKNFKMIILVIAVLLVLIIVRNADQNVFRGNPKKAIEVTRDNNNLITLSELKGLGTSFLVVELRNGPKPDSLQFAHSIQIPMERLLDNQNRKILDQMKGELILFSDDIGTASKAWIILHQLGYQNVRILTLDENPGELKYKFQPDTTAKLEQDSM